MGICYRPCSHKLFVTIHGYLCQLQHVVLEWTLFYKLPILMNHHGLSGCKSTLTPNLKTLLANNKSLVCLVRG